MKEEQLTKTEKEELSFAILNGDSRSCFITGISEGRCFQLSRPEPLNRRASVPEGNPVWPQIQVMKQLVGFHLKTRLPPLATIAAPCFGVAIAFAIVRSGVSQ